jgi:hypothetical protein
VTVNLTWTAGRANFLIANSTTGGTLTLQSSAGTNVIGTLTLAAKPVLGLQAATKNYVDDGFTEEAPNNGFTYGRNSLAWRVVPQLVQVANTGFDLNTITGGGSGPAGPFTGYIGWHQISNQTTGIGAVNFPDSQQTGLVLSGYNSNPGWDSQLFMGAMTSTPQLYYRASSSQGIFGAWFQVLTSAGGKITGPVGFNGSNALAKPVVTGSRLNNPALASLLTQLANYGLVTDNTVV